MRRPPPQGAVPHLKAPTSKTQGLAKADMSVVPPWLKPNGRKCLDDAKPIFELLHRRVCAIWVHESKLRQFLVCKSDGQPHPIEEGSLLNRHMADEDCVCTVVDGLIVGVDAASRKLHVMLRAIGILPMHITVGGECLASLGEFESDGEAWLFSTQPTREAPQLPCLVLEDDDQKVSKTWGSWEDQDCDDNSGDADCESSFVKPMVVLYRNRTCVKKIQCSLAIQAWLDAGGDVNAMTPPPRNGKRGYTLLMAACACAPNDAMTSLVDTLLARKADVNMLGLKAVTALHCAASVGDKSVPIMKLLLDARASVNMVSMQRDFAGDRFGTRRTEAVAKTPLDCALRAGMHSTAHTFTRHSLRRPECSLL